MIFVDIKTMVVSVQLNHNFIYCFTQFFFRLGGMYLLTVTPVQYDQIKGSLTGIKVKPTTDKTGSMTFKLNEAQWNQFQKNQAGTLYF